MYPKINILYGIILFLRTFQIKEDILNEIMERVYASFIRIFLALNISPSSLYTLTVC